MKNAVLQEKNPIHKTVMVDEVIELLSPYADGVYVDATLGVGGHTEAILRAAGGRAKVIGFDVDEESISLSKNRLSAFGDRVEFQNRNFTEIDEGLGELGLDKVDGIIADLGMSSFQLEESGRGFSFMRDEPLDMRMDKSLDVSARELVNEAEADEIVKILKEYGEERWAKRIANHLMDRRTVKPISTSAALATIVSEAIPRKYHPERIHPATKTFQALRIAVNNELENLDIFLEKSPDVLKLGARIVVISFHSLEDRLVKNTFKRLSSPCVCPPDLPVCGCGRKGVINIVTPSPLTPSQEELEENPRGRSAKMRAAERK